MRYLSAILFFIFSIFSLYSAAHNKTPIEIVSGNVAGVYYPTAGAFCRTINKYSNLVYCGVLISDGSISTIDYIRKFPNNFALIQSDIADNAYRATGLFSSEAKFSELRKVFITSSELLTLIVRNDMGVNTLEDFHGKKLKIGYQGNGTRSLVEQIRKYRNWQNDFAEMIEINSANLIEELCDKKIDVVALTVSHPNGLVQESLKNCSTRLIPLNAKELSAISKQSPYFKVAKLNRDLYNFSEDVPTIAVESGIYTTAGVTEEVVYEFVKQIFSNLKDVQVLHPVLASLEAKNMIDKKAQIPLHLGAKKYYLEHGFIKKSFR